MTDDPVYYTESGFAFVLIGIPGPDDLNEPMVMVYDLEHREVAIPGDEAVMGRFLTAFQRRFLLDAHGVHDLKVQGSPRLVVPKACMVHVIERLR